MRAYDIIAGKRDGQTLSSAEIDFMVHGFADGLIPESQMAAWLMAVYLRGFDKSETAALTGALISSGRIVDLTDISGLKVDKHSTGGVGDKISLVVVPLAAAAGMIVPKMSGCGLGHTGGTLDKLEAIPGFRTSLQVSEFKSQLKQVGAAIIGQNSDLVPADKKIYTLRDITATVSSAPLIAASIMSKKLAAGADAIVLDVKIGSGAFMKDITQGRELARTMVALGREMSHPTRAILSNMHRPLGRAIGNALEVSEAIDVLRGFGPPDVRELSVVVAAEMMMLAGLAADGDHAAALLNDLLDGGRALAKFVQIVSAQGGDIRVIEDPDRLPKAENGQDYLADNNGYLAIHNSEFLGAAGVELGTGHCVPGQRIDHGAGLKLLKKEGEPVLAGEPLIKLYFGPGANLNGALDYISRAIGIADEPPELEPLVYEVIEG